MPRNKISDLRDHMFEVFEKVKDGEMDITRAKALANIAQVIVNSASAEVRAMNAMNAMGEGTHSGFFELSSDEKPARTALPSPKPNGGTGPNEGIHAKDPLREPRRIEPDRKSS